MGVWGGGEKWVGFPNLPLPSDIRWYLFCKMYKVRKTELTVLVFKVKGRNCSVN